MTAQPTQLARKRRDSDSLYMEPETRDHFVYRCYDAAGVLLYVGCAAHPKKRMRQHLTGPDMAPWAVDLHRVTFEEFGTRTAAQMGEAAAIRAERPIWNITYTPRPVPTSYVYERHVSVGAA